MIKHTEPRRGVPLRPDWRAYYERDDHVAQLVRSAIVIGRAALAGNRQPLDDFLPSEWRSDREFEQVLRAASSPITSTTAAVLSTVAPQFLRALTPFSAGAALLASGIVVSFDGAGSLSFPSLAAPSGMPSFISESSPIPSWNLQSAAGSTLYPCVFAALTSATSEMINSVQAEALIRQALLDASSLALDSALFGNAAEVVGTSPPGLLNGLSSLTASTATPKSDAMADDVEALIGAVGPVSANSPVALVCGAPQAAALKLRTQGSADFPVFTTSALAAKTVLAVATQALVSAADPPRIDASQHVLIHEDSVALPIASGATISAPARSFFQTDSVSLRLRWPLSWLLRDSRAAAVVAGVTW